MLYEVALTDISVGIINTSLKMDFFSSVLLANRKVFSGMQMEG